MDEKSSMFAFLGRLKRTFSMQASESKKLLGKIQDVHHKQRMCVVDVRIDSTAVT